MEYERLEIPEVIKLSPQIFKDSRGEFFETFKLAEFSDFVGKKINFVQDNQSLSIKSGTVRGLHFQRPPFAQGKLVRCIKGSIIDVAVDARRKSPTYGKWVRAELSARNYFQLWVPEGFLHGFATLEPNTIVQYKCTNLYSAEHDEGVLWNDSSLGIDWAVNHESAILSKKDEMAQLFAAFSSPF